MSINVIFLTWLCTVAVNKTYRPTTYYSVLYSAYAFVCRLCKWAERFFFAKLMAEVASTCLYEHTWSSSNYGE